jgi:hypothetical protein
MALDENEMGEGINAKVLVGAALVGAGEGVMHAAENEAATVSKLIEPGDQRHILHPLDETIAGIRGALRKIATPGDMNLNQSPHPVDDAVNLHQAMLQKTTDTLTEKGLVEGVRIGSVAVATVLAENADPFKKLPLADAAGYASKTLDIAEIDAIKPVISWNTYEHLLGNGSQPPKLKSLRDFSDLMEYTPPRSGDWSSRLSYHLNDEHRISMRLYHLWGTPDSQETMTTAMRFTVRAEGDRELHGSGAEMFHSAMKLFSQEGINIKEIQGSWGRDGVLSTNFNEFYKARQQGSTVKEAVAMTPTGRWAADAGFTEVGGWSFNKAVSSRIIPDSLEPVFTRPKFHPEHQSYNDYGQAWVGSQGRDTVDLVPRYVAKLDAELSDMSSQQQAKIKQLMVDKLDAWMQRQEPAVNQELK